MIKLVRIALGESNEPRRASGWNSFTVTKGGKRV
jgi:hypothetical protein